MALYIAGLLLLDRWQNGTRADWLPARAHDAINRLLPFEMPDSSVGWRCVNVV